MPCQAAMAAVAKATEHGRNGPEEQQATDKGPEECVMKRNIQRAANLYLEPKNQEIDSTIAESLTMCPLLVQAAYGGVASIDCEVA